MLWLVSILGIIITTGAAIWIRIDTHKIDEEIERVENMLRTATNGAYEEQKQLAHEYGVKYEQYEFFTDAVRDVVKTLKRRKKRAVYLFAILAATGATIAIVAIVWQNLGH